MNYGYEHTQVGLLKSNDNDLNKRKEVNTMDENVGFGNGGMWIFALLILLLIGGGNVFGGNTSRTASIEDLNNQSNFTRLENQVRANAELVERKTDAINNGICSLGYEMANKFSDTNALIITENQKTRDLIQQNKIEQLQARINQLELKQACGGCSCNTSI